MEESEQDGRARLEHLDIEPWNQQLASPLQISLTELKFLVAVSVSGVDPLRFLELRHGLVQ